MAQEQSRGVIQVGTTPTEFGSVALSAPLSSLTITHERYSQTKCRPLPRNWERRLPPRILAHVASYARVVTDEEAARAKGEFVMAIADQLSVSVQKP